MRTTRAVSVIGIVPIYIAILIASAGIACGEKLPIKTLTTADGLARDNIAKIFQDSKGFIWFCTTEGISRYDGYGFRNYGIADGLAGRRASDFLESHDGSYWVATDKGLCRFIPDQTTASGETPRFIRYYPADAAAVDAVTTILEDRRGTIWCGTEAGLIRLDNANGEWVTSAVPVAEPQKYAALVVRALVQDEQGRIWIGTDSGLFRQADDARVERYEPSQSTHPVGPVRTLLNDPDGHLWVGTTKGLYRLNPRLSRDTDAPLVYKTNDGLGSDWILCLSKSAENNLWVGTARGLSEFVPAMNGRRGGFRSYNENNGLTVEGFTAITEDQSGNLWLGTPFSGVMRLAAHGFTSYGLNDGLGLPDVRVATIFETQSGELVIGTDAHVLIHSGAGAFAPVRVPLPKGVADWGWGWYQTILQDHTGDWWMSSWEGLVRYPPVSDVRQLARMAPKRIYRQADGLTNNLIFRIFEDSRGDIWIGTIGNPDGLLARWDRSTDAIKVYKTSDGVPGVAPTAFREDAAGDLWIGLYTGGLLRYRGGRFEHFGQAEGVPPGLIRGIYLDHSNRLWIATDEGGVARVDDPPDQAPVFKTYALANGLSSNQATAVTEDLYGMIYVGTGRGVDRIEPQTGRIEHYSTTDGLAGSFVNIAFRGRDGALWFGLIPGLSRLVPTPPRPTPPVPICITSVKIAGAAYPVTEMGAVTITTPDLAPSQNNLQIEFASLAAAAGQSVKYVYQLEGTDSGWSAPTDQRVVSYPNLSPGSYTFLVRAVAADGVMSAAPATITFRVLRPVYRRWWFLLLIVLALAGIAGALGRARSKRLRALRESETRFRTLAETASDAIITIDEDSRIVLVNRAAERVFGHHAPDLAGQDLAILMPEYLRHIHRQGLDRYRKTGIRHISWQSVELPGLHKDGHEIPLEVSFGEFARDGKRFFTGIARDVTERKRAEEERRQAEETLQRAKTERLRELEQVRRRIATDLHDDIGASLTQISILSEVVLQRSGGDYSADERSLSMIARSSRELVDSMSDIVWAINPQKDHLSDLAQRMRRFASDVLTARSIAFEFREPDEMVDIAVGAAIRREVYLIFKESINNLVRHSECTEAEIEFDIADDTLKLRVSDNGKGFNLDLDREGHGLTSMRQRAQSLGGAIEIASADGTGTTITLLLLLRPHLAVTNTT